MHIGRDTKYISWHQFGDKKSSKVLINLLVWCSSMHHSVLYAGCHEGMHCFVVITKASLIVESWCFGELMMVINYMTSWLWVFATQTEQDIIGNSLWRSQKTGFKYSKNFPSLFQGHLTSLICPQAKEEDRSYTYSLRVVGILHLRFKKV
jgi:hypothetical protein